MIEERMTPLLVVMAYAILNRLRIFFPGVTAMHIDPTTHEHGASGTVYSYEGNFEVGDDAIAWDASVRQSGVPRCNFTGTVPLTSPALAAMAEKVVRDAIVKCIDSFDDSQGSAVDAVVGAR
jgi:hypothetical protein